MTPSYRVPRRHDSGENYTKRLAMIAGGIGGVLLVIGGVWSMSGHHGGVPVVEAASGPVRSKPVSAGGMQVAGQNESILGSANPSDSKAALAPLPEAPAPQALKAQAAATPAPTPPAPTPAVPAPAPLVTPMLASAPANMAPPSTPAPRVAATAAPAKVDPAKPAPAKPPAMAAGHGPQVQLAALTTEQAAKTEWDRLARKMPAVFDGHKPAVQKTEHDGKTFWRLRTGGFADTAQATSFCAEVKSKGVGCEVARS